MKITDNIEEVKRWLFKGTEYHDRNSAVKAKLLDYIVQNCPLETNDSPFPSGFTCGPPPYSLPPPGFGPSLHVSENHRTIADFILKHLNQINGITNERLAK